MTKPAFEPVLNRLEPFARKLGSLLLIGICYLSLPSCNNKTQTPQDARSSAIKKIDSLQQVLKTIPGGPAATQTALQLAEAYQFFAFDYKQDSMALPFILKEANIYAAFGDHVKAAELHKYGYDNYPDHPLRPNALFFMGNALHDAGDSAGCIVVFERFIKEYPNHEFTAGARQMADMMKRGRGSLEAFIEKRAKQVADSLAAVQKSGKPNS